MLTLYACHDKDNYEPGPVPTNTKGSVYFAGDYEAENIYGDQPTIKDTLWIAVVRDSSNIKDAMDVPIKAETDGKVNVPDHASFEAGKDSAWIALTFPNVEFTKESKFTLTIPDEYANPYKEKDGTTTLQSSILWSAWQDVADTVLITSSYYVFPDQGCKLQNLNGKNRFRFSNFMGSGNPLEFSINTEKGFNSKDLTDNAGNLSPLKNYYSESYGWDWANDGNYTHWTPTGGSFEISYMAFYPSIYGNYDWIDLSIKNKTTYKLDGKKYYYDYDAYCKSVELVYIYDAASKKSTWDYIYFMILYRITDDN